MRIVRRVLCLGIVIVLLLVPAASAQDGSTEIDVPQTDDAEAFEVDGRLDEPAWQSAAQEQIRLTGVDDEDRVMFAQLYVAHNGSAYFIALSGTDLDTVTYQLEGGAGSGSFGPGTDGMRTDAGGASVDLHWDRDSEEWRADEDAEDCAANGTTARSGSGDQVVVESTKPMQGDACDAFIAPGQTLAVRLLVEDATGQTYVWPGGSADDDVGGWAFVTLLDAFGDAGQPIGGEPMESPTDHDLETREEPGVDRGVPSAPGVEPEGPAYNAESEQETSALGWGLMALAGVAGLALVAALRRS